MTLQEFVSLTRNGPTMARCIRPNHRDTNPSVIISEDHAWCFGCGSFWWPDQFVRELGERSLETSPVAHKTQRPVRYIPKSMVTTFNRWLNVEHSVHLDWLLARGLRLGDSINANLLGYNGTAYVIPIMDGDKVQSLRFRRDDQWGDDLDEDSSPKYWGLPGLNKVTLYKPIVPDWVTLKSPAIHLCEGELDALRLAQEGLIAWSLTNGCRTFGSEHIKEFQGYPVKVVYDQDEPGRTAARRISRMMDCQVITWPEVLGKDVTEFLQRWSLQAFLKQL